MRCGAMCELLGMSFNQPVNSSFTFRGFRKRGEYNPDGWGLAYYPDRSVQVIKEPLRSTKSKLAGFIKNYHDIQSKIYIAHVRYKSSGDKSYKNTHPFQRELHGKEYVFAHNGTLRNYTSLTRGIYRPVGDTDSERAFCFILNQIHEQDITRWEQKHFEWLWQLLKEINDNGSFNCIFSDGEYLFCYFDANGYNGLCFVQRRFPFGTVCLEDDDYKIDLSHKKKKDPSQKGFIIATKRLTNERWDNFNPGELIVFRNGEIIYSSSGRDHETFSTDFNENELNILRYIRQQPHRVSLRSLCDGVGLSRQEIVPWIHSLLCKGYITQDRRDRVRYDHDQATFYTVTSKRSEIDSLIKQ